jgi:sulfur carrier protein ThiS
VRVNVALFGLYRDKLPREARGQAELDVPAEATLADVLARLDINAGALCVLNGQAEPDKARRLQDGDKLQVIPPTGGG